MLSMLVIFEVAIAKSLIYNQQANSLTLIRALHYISGTSTRLVLLIYSVPPSLLRQ